MATELWATLKQDHRNLTALLGDMEGRYQWREGLLRQIRDEAEAHFRGEEQVLYPAFRSVAGFRDLIEEASDRHREILRQLQGLEAATEEEWEARLSVLRSVLHGYIEEEEDKIIDFGRGKLPAHTVEHLKHEFSAAKKAVFEKSANG